ncbi:MAG: zf-HC2 domain-containing protein [Holophagae bacterium]|jgi:anti-sigma factor RsiW
MSPPRDFFDCDGVDECLEAFVDGDLSSAELQAVEAHLRRCPNCSVALKRARRVRAELRSLPSFELPDRVVRAASTSIKQKSHGRTRGATFRRWWRPAPTLAAAAAAIVLAVSLGLWRESPESGASTAEAEQLAADARLALAYVGRMTHYAERELRDRVVLGDPAVTTVRGVAQAMRWTGGAGGGLALPEPPADD